MAMMNTKISSLETSLGYKILDEWLDQSLHPQYMYVLANIVMPYQYDRYIDIMCLGEEESQAVQKAFDSGGC